MSSGSLSLSLRRSAAAFFASKSSSSSYSNLLVTKDTTSLATALTLSSTNFDSSFLGTQIHGCIIKLGLSNDVFSQNNLIKMYSKSGVFTNGLKVFDEMPLKNLVSWTLLISGAIQNGELEMGLEVFLDMTRNGFNPNEFTLGSVMKVCTTTTGATRFGLSIHCFAFKIGLENNPFVGTSILNLYSRMGDIEAATRVFECINNPDLACWNALLGVYAQCENGMEAMSIVALMRHQRMRMDEFTFINALKSCLVTGDLNFGREVHALIVRSEMQCCTPVMNALLDMYNKNGEKKFARKLFNAMQDKDVISWNTVFASFSPYQDGTEVASLFHKFMLTGLKPNCVTFSILFRLCGESLDLNLGFQFYCIALQFGFCDEANIVSSLINMFSRCGAIEAAHIIFNSVPSNNIVIWNEMIAGCNFNSCSTESVKIFSYLWKLGVEANEYTFSSVLEACSQAEDKQLCRQIHGALLKSGFVSHSYVYSSLIRAYARFGLLDDSYELFDGHEKLDLVSWGAMISSLMHKCCNYEAFRLLNCLIKAGEKPDEFIFGSILNGCARTAAHLQTYSMHSLVIKSGFETHVFVASALLAAYAKCGDIESARLAFNQSSHSGDVVLYNAMIMAYSHHGLVMEAMEIFKKMKLAHLQPSQATFVSVLSTCSHLGLVDEGRILFKSIKLNYGMEPSPENYGCLVDMLSRNGFLEDAKDIIQTMPFSPWPAVLRSLLSGCRIHGNRELGEWAAKKLNHLVPENDAAYVLLSKVYSEEGSWEDAAKVRRGMAVRGSADRTVKFWHLETFELIGSAGPETTGVRHMTFSPDGRIVLCGFIECLKVFSWEPIRCHDVVDAGWSRLSDLNVHEGKASWVVL